MNEERAMMDFGGGSMNMSIPERIVLSAGYDGDDNKDASQSFRDSSTFDETPIVNPDKALAGMQTPPSVLTIDHGSYNRSPTSFHTEGDGADEDDSMSSLKKYAHLLKDSQSIDEDYTSIVSPRTTVIAGEENHILDKGPLIPYDDPHALQRWCMSMQRRLTVLENELEYQNRLSNVWKYLLLTLTVVNPFIVNYFFFSRRR